MRPGSPQALEEADPDAVIHAAALSSAEAVYRDPARGCGRQRRGDPAAGRLGARGMTDGSSSPRPTWSSTARGPGIARTIRPPDPRDTAGPSCEAERSCWRSRAAWSPDSACFTVRTCGGNPGFFDLALAALARGEPRPFFRDEFRTPLDYRTAADDPRPAGRIGCRRASSTSGAGSGSAVTS